MTRMDEALEPASLMNQLIFPLVTARSESGAPVCRLLAGVRSDPEFSRLRALAVSEHGLIDLDDVSDDRLLRDLEEYVDKLLKSQPPYDQRMHAPARAAFAAAVAEALVSRRAGRRWGEFLVAALYTHHLLTTHDPIVDSRVAETLGLRAPSELREVLELDLLRRNNVSFLRPVLAVLAHALGEGMPASLIRAVTPLFAANRHPSADEITAALEAARFYLRCTADTDGTVVYRLFHQGLADYLRDHPVSPDIPAVPTAIAQGILSHILRTLSAPGENVELAPRQWAFAEPYLLRHALQHAVTAGRPALVAGDPEFLVCADPSILVLFFSGTSVPEELIPVAEIYLSSVGKPENLGSNDRRQALAVAAAAHGLADLARRLASPPGQPPLAWQPLWAMTRRLSANVEGGFVPVKIATVADLLSGPAIIAVTRDGASSSWDLATGKHLNRWRGFYPDGELKEVRIGGQTTILASSAGAPRHSCPRPAGRDDNSGVTRPSGGCRRRRYIRFPANRQPRRIAFMTRILGIHGIGNFQAGLPPEAAGQLLGQRWEAALPHAAAAGVIDVRVAYYAHCLGPARAQGSDELAHLTPSAEQFVMAWVKALGAPAEIAQGRVGAPVRQAADWIAARYGLDRRSVHLLIARFAAEVDRYINLSDCRVRARQAVTQCHLA